MTKTLVPQSVLFVPRKQQKRKEYWSES